MRIGKDVRDAATALFGGTSAGVVGCSLQWAALAILVFDSTLGSGSSVQVRMALLTFGVVSVPFGIWLAFRGNALGPIIVVPGFAGFVLLLTLTAVTYPLRLFTDDRQP